MPFNKSSLWDFYSLAFGQNTRKSPSLKRYEPMNFLRLILILATFFSTGAKACPAPPPGYGLTHEELIERTETIVLALAVKVTDKVVVFKVVEVLKGESEEEFFWRRSRIPEAIKHINTDFSGHTEPAFWSDFELVRRSPISRGGICNISFTYQVGEMYLVFRESWGHAHSNEIIKSKNDKWLISVREAVAVGS